MAAAKLLSPFFFLFGLLTVVANGDFDVTFVVDSSGAGNFTKLQHAIDAVPLNNNRWVQIRILQGTYREKVVIPIEKPFIFLKGDGKRKTLIVWNDHGNIDESPTFICAASHIIAKSISFINSYNYPLSPNVPVMAAPAALVMGDRVVFYRCGFVGFQDTLWDERGRHYYRLCTIQGFADFIFGQGQSFFERCTISVTGRSGYIGYITAQGRSSSAASDGYVFKDCNVLGDGQVYLGRPWRSYGRVIFYNTFMSDTIVPQGWDPWSAMGREYQLTFSEYGCSGPGSSKSGRVPWANRASPEELRPFLSISYVDGNEGWVSSYCDMAGCFNYTDETRGGERL